MPMMDPRDLKQLPYVAILSRWIQFLAGSPPHDRLGDALRKPPTKTYNFKRFGVRDADE